jgi:hypothetical protein
VSECNRKQDNWWPQTALPVIPNTPANIQIEKGSIKCCLFRLFFAALPAGAAFLPAELLYKADWRKAGYLFYKIQNACPFINADICAVLPGKLN